MWSNCKKDYFIIYDLISHSVSFTYSCFKNIPEARHLSGFERRVAMVLYKKENLFIRLFLNWKGKSFILFFEFVCA